MSASEPLPGTSDIWEPEISGWLDLENTARKVFNSFGYAELRTPIIERTEVFVKNLGNETDVVQKEMYTFQDRGGRSLTLRPEGTAGVMRAIANHGLEQGAECRVFYTGPMFRGERPAAGRRRQFHQMGVEAVGNTSPWMDAEVIAMLVQYLDKLGITGAKVKINTRGIPEERPAISAKLVEYFTPHLDSMCDDCKRRISTNVWRMLDCKNPACAEIAAGAPKIVDMLTPESKEYFDKVCKGLDAMGVDYELAPRLVRGLDYYVHTVFEVTHPGLGAQDALAGGGRYRIAVPGSKQPIEGIGFAAGMERLLIARESLGITAPEISSADTFVVALGENAIPAGLKIAGELRQKGIGGRVKADFSNRSMKAQMRTANQNGAKCVIIIGENELANQKAIVKNMTTSEQQEVAFDAIADALAK